VNKITYITKIENGRMTRNRSAIFKAIQIFEGKELEITLSRPKRKRSNSQNSYWWGVVVPIYHKLFTEAGHACDHNGAHYLLCDLIRENYPDTVLFDEVLINDTYVKRTKGTSELTKSEFMSLIAEAQQLASEWFGAYIPDPNEQLTIK
jgi:hypothetical protein